MKNSTLKFALTLAVTVLFAQATLAMPIAKYDPSSGNITFDGLDGTNTMRLFSTGGNLIPDVGDALGFALTEKTATLYSWADFGGGITGDGLNAGDIVTPGTDVSDLSFDFTMGLTGGITPSTIMVVGGGDMLDPNPANGSTIDLTDAYRNNGGSALAAISFTGTGTINSVSVDSQSLPGLFGASIDGLNIDLTVDLPTGQTQPAGTMHDAVLNIVTSAGDFSYDLTSTVPEPTTLGLIGLGLVGLFGARRRS